MFFREMLKTIFILPGWFSINYLNPLGIDEYSLEEVDLRDASVGWILFLLFLGPFLAIFANAIFKETFAFLFSALMVAFLLMFIVIYQHKERQQKDLPSMTVKLACIFTFLYLLSIAIAHYYLF